MGGIMVDRYASKDYVMRERKRKRERKRESEWYVAAAAATAPMVGSTLEKY
jgi:uncharacterized Fe-S cluster-containing radical SAM superfamily protein